MDIVTENDLRALALGLEGAERRGKKLLYRVGPPFVRARIGQEIRQALTGDEAYEGNTPSTAGGLIVVGSHVGLTTRQLKALTAQHGSARIIEIDVEKLFAAEADDAWAYRSSCSASSSRWHCVPPRVRPRLRSSSPRASSRPPWGKAATPRRRSP